MFDIFYFHFLGGNAFSTEATPGIFSENLMEYQVKVIFRLLLPYTIVVSASYCIV